MKKTQTTKEKRSPKETQKKPKKEGKVVLRGNRSRVGVNKEVCNADEYERERDLPAGADQLQEVEAQPIRAVVVLGAEGFAGVRKLVQQAVNSLSDTMIGWNRKE